MSATALSQQDQKDLPLWLPEYNRDALPAGVDNSLFGTSGKLVQLLDLSVPAPFARTVTRLPDRTLPQVTVFGLPANVEPPVHTKRCDVSFTVGISAPIPGYTITPDHAFIYKGDGPFTLLSESEWASNLPFNKYVRCDRSTNWQWRFDFTNNPHFENLVAVDEECYFAYHRYGYNYYHWMIDCLPRVWALKTFGGVEQARWYLGKANRRYQMASLGLYDIDPDRIIEFEDDQFVHLKRAIVPGFRFEEPLKLRHPDFQTGVWNVGWSPAFLQDLRDRGWAKIPHSPGDLKIYVSRTDAGHRQLRNEPELRALLESEGFTTFVPGEHSFDEQVATFSRARVVVGVHGAGLSNIIWAPTGCAVIELQPESFPTLSFRAIGQMCDHHYTLVICNSVSELQADSQWTDVKVNIGAVREALRSVA